MNKLHVLLLFGGESSEHEISLKSAHNVYAALDNTKYEVTLCYIDKAGRFWLTDSIDGSNIGSSQLFPRLGQRSFEIAQTGEVIAVDVLFPVLHGANGEDGTVQGLARLLHIACVGPSLLGSAVTIDKDMTKRLCATAGVPVVPWRVVRRSQKHPSIDELRGELGPVLFVKPLSAGSSIATHRVISNHELHDALLDVFHYDSAAIIEQAIDAREVEFAMLGNQSPTVSVAGEIVTGEEFYSYDDKYAATSTAATVVPAVLPDDVVSQLRHYAEVAYRATNGQGMARIDFFIDRVSHQIYLNEVNSIPGFTNSSMYPKLWHEAGLSYAELVNKLIQLAQESV